LDKKYRPYYYIFTLFIAVIIICNADISPAKTTDKASATTSSAVIFVYHRIGEDQYPASNLRIEQFEAHIRELKTGDYNVLPVHQIVKALKTGTDLPDKTVGITFEGAYKSTLENAVPRLTDAKLPFTLFIAPSRIDRKSPHYMTWKHLRKLKKSKYIDIAALPSSYNHLLFEDDITIRRQTNETLSRLREELDLQPKLFAYPFGEHSTTLRAHIKQQGYEAAFGQHSGVAHTQSDFFILPRFSMTENYGDLTRFQMTAGALPLPVHEMTPHDPILNTENNPPIIGFTLDDSISDDKSDLSCFASEQGRIPMQKIESNRIELRPEMPFSEGRVRINCTMKGPVPAPGEPQRWRWLGLMLTVPETE